MIYEPAHVVELDKDPRYAWVQSASQAGCPRCAAGQGCGNGLFARLLGTRLHRIRVVNQAGAAQNDEVMIGLSESALLRGAFFAYGVPILLLVGGILLGSIWGELASLLGALLGLGAGLLLLMLYSKPGKHQHHFQPVVMHLRKKTDWETDCRWRNSGLP